MKLWKGTPWYKEHSIRLWGASIFHCNLFAFARRCLCRRLNPRSAFSCQFSLCTLKIEIQINVTANAILMVLSPWHSHCNSSPSSFDQCRLSACARWPPTPDQAIQLGLWVACTLLTFTPIVAIYIYYLARKASAHFTVWRRVESWVVTSLRAAMSFKSWYSLT